MVFRGTGRLSPAIWKHRNVNKTTKEREATKTSGTQGSGDKTDWRDAISPLSQAECTPALSVLSHVDKMVNKQCCSVLR